MFVDGSSSYDRDDAQTSRGYFLILVQLEEDWSSPIRGIVRHVVLKQFGHWMMGKARIGKHTITLSGAYGADGLICSVPQEIYEKGVEVPKELVEAWNKGGGWNGAGSEAPLMREWAKKTFRSNRSE